MYNYTIGKWERLDYPLYAISSFKRKSTAAPISFAVRCLEFVMFLFTCDVAVILWVYGLPLNHAR